jgi:hypothetical protein
LKRNAYCVETGSRKRGVSKEQQATEGGKEDQGVRAREPTERKKKKK